MDTAEGTVVVTSVLDLEIASCVVAETACGIVKHAAGALLFRTELSKILFKGLIGVFLQKPGKKQKFLLS